MKPFWEYIEPELRLKAGGDFLKDYLEKKDLEFKEFMLKKYAEEDRLAKIAKELKRNSKKKTKKRRT